MDPVRQIAEFLTMPVVHTITGKGILSDEHPLNMGVVGIFANAPCADSTLRGADLVFIVGSKSSQSSSFLWTVPTPEQKVIHLDVDPGEVGRIFRTDIGLVGDARLGLEAILAELESGGARVVDEERLDQLQVAKTAWEEKKAGLFSRNNVPIQPYRVMAAVNNVLGPDDILVCDAGFSSGWGALYFHQRGVGRRTVFPRGLAGLGFSVAAGIGAQLAAPGSRVVTLAGDAGFSYDMGELSVQAQINLPVVNIVLNNSAYGWVKWAQQAWYQGSFDTSELPSINFAKVAEGLGCVGMRVEDPGQLESSLTEALSLNKPVVLDIVTDDASTPNVN
jgi:acetolactate synthase-1/2/3 large subunit